MVKIIIGLKGSGKTKHLVELVNKAVETSPGNVVCIEKGNKLMFDLNHKVRLIDTDSCNISDAKELYGLVCGVISANYDIKDVFIDSSLKICGNNLADFEWFVDALDKLSADKEISFVTTASIDAKDFPDKLNKYLI